MLKILFFGDIYGRLGRAGLAKVLPELKKDLKPDLVIANAENSAHGNGLTRKIYDELMVMGVDFLTLGDHTFDRPETVELLSDSKLNLTRPANYPPGTVGTGEKIVEVGTRKILIVNMLGRVFMKMDYDCPFRKIDEIIAKYKSEKLSGIIVDFHAEATSEKCAFGWYVDGRVSAVLGTHTHAATCDQRILPQQTAFISDVGMVGPRDSVIGVKKELVLDVFLSQRSRAFEPAEESPCRVNAVLLTIDPKTGNTQEIIRVDREVNV